MFQYLEEEKRSISTLGAKSDVFWQDTLSIKPPFGRYNPFEKPSRSFDRSRSRHRLFGKSSHPFCGSRSIDHLLGESSHCLSFATLYLSATKGISASGLWHITTATHTMPSFYKLSIKHPSDTSSIKYPFSTTRNHGLVFTTTNLLRPSFTNAKHSLPTNENQQLKLLFLTLEQQLLGRRAQSLILSEKLH